MVFHSDWPTRRNRVQVERWQRAVFEQLAEINRLHTKLLRVEQDLDAYLNDKDWPERRKTFDRFLAAGGRKAHEWQKWLRGDRPRPQAREERYRLLSGPRLAWSNPNHAKRRFGDGSGPSAA